MMEGEPTGTDRLEPTHMMAGSLASFGGGQRLNPGSAPAWPPQPDPTKAGRLAGTGHHECVLPRVFVFAIVHQVSRYPGIQISRYPSIHTIPGIRYQKNALI